MARMINHIDLTVGDMARSRAFYTPVLRYLGFEVTEDNAEELVFGDADQSSVTSIALHPAHGEGRGIPHNRRAPGLHHLAFDAESRSDVDGLHALLNELGAEILDPPATYYQPNYYAVFFADPDGMKLELAHIPSLQTLSPEAKTGGTREPVLNKIDCVLTKVDDLDSARRFYEGVLGLEPLWSDVHSVALGMPRSEAEIVLHDNPEIPKECNVHYLVNDVNSVAAKLSAEGCAVVEPPFEVRIGKCAVIRDPFGNLLNLIDMSKGPVEYNLRGSEPER